MVDVMMWRRLQRTPKCSKQHPCNGKMQHIKDSIFFHFFSFDDFFPTRGIDETTKRLFDGREREDGNSSSRNNGYYLTRISETKCECCV